MKEGFIPPNLQKKTTLNTPNPLLRNLPYRVPCYDELDGWDEALLFSRTKKPASACCKARGIAAGRASHVGRSP